jgi:hypothetical protein
MRTTDFCVFLSLVAFAQPPQTERLGFHDIRTDKAGNILPWYADDPARSYDHTLQLVWNYWRLMPNYWESTKEFETNFGKTPGLRKFYVTRTQDEFGIGGDQFGMILNSWSLYYAYTGDKAVLNDMLEQADVYLKNSLSGPGDAWPNLPYPVNLKKRAVYDGDLIMGEGYTQPDKAGSFAAELVTLYKITGDRRWLDAAVKIAGVLAAKTQPGDAEHSPLPFRVHTKTGESKWPYTSNWVPTLRLFESLIALKEGDTKSYQRAFVLISDWLKAYPLKTMKWGPFFEDIGAWSDTQINAVTLAWWMLERPEWNANWKEDSRRCLDWAWNELGVDKWKGYGVRVIGEQTAYRMEGQSHSSRQASVELLYAAKTGDTSRKENAARMLNWATYFVDVDGKNRYPNPRTYELWWTDGYGDFVRHYLRGMAAAPELAPSGADHILQSTSVIRNASYGAREIRYEAFDPSGEELLRLAAKPRVMQPTWKWVSMSSGGVLRIKREGTREVVIPK